MTPHVEMHPGDPQKRPVRKWICSCGEAWTSVQKRSCMKSEPDDPPGTHDVTETT
jgi:hypothetical protein